MKLLIGDQPEIHDSVRFASNNQRVRKLLTASYIGLLHYAGCREDKQVMVENFLHRLGDGQGLLEHHPVYQLRKFLEAQQGPRQGRRRPGREYILALAVKAWNGHKAEKRMLGLKFQINEPFPTL